MAVPREMSTSVYDLKRMITSRKMFCVPLADKGELAGAKGCKKCLRKNPTKTKKMCVEAFRCRTAEHVIFIDTKIRCEKKMRAKSLPITMEALRL